VGTHELEEEVKTEVMADANLLTSPRQQVHDHEHDLDPEEFMKYSDDFEAPPKSSSSRARQHAQVNNHERHSSPRDRPPPPSSSPPPSQRRTAQRTTVRDSSVQTEPTAPATWPSGSEQQPHGYGVGPLPPHAFPYQAYHSAPPFPSTAFNPSTYIPIHHFPPSPYGYAMSTPSPQPQAVTPLLALVPATSVPMRVDASNYFHTQIVSILSTINHCRDILRDEQERWTAPPRTTLHDTEKFIENHAPKTTTMAEALQTVRNSKRQSSR